MDKLVKRLVNLLRVWKKLLLLKDSYWASTLTAYSIPSQDVFNDRGAGKLLLKRLNVSIEKEQNLFLLEGYWFAVLLAESLQAKFRIDEQHRVFINVAGMEANIETQEELLILKELYADGVYNILFPSPVVVWDIGMNVGLASIFFACKQDSFVVGFEPFTKTFNQALHNISLNPAISQKIRAFNSGLSDTAGKVYAEYTREIAGNLGIYGVEQKLRRGRQFDHEEIVLEDVRQILDVIVADYPDRTIVAKIDCEGSEYQILQALAAAGKLHLLKVIMLEWHVLKPEQDPSIIEKLLHDSNFNVFFPKPLGKSSGMMYALSNKGN